MPITQENVVAALRQVKEPEIFKDIVTLNMVRDVSIDGSTVAVTVEMPAPNSPVRDQLQKDITAALKAAGAGDVRVAITVRGQSQQAPAAKTNSALPQVKNVVAVGAGKGGVGKSTVALNLAVGLQRTGASVGLMDGDIYGPSMPTMLGVKGVQPKLVGQKIQPLQVHGIHAITIGSLVESDKPLIWRGPMAHGAFKQLLLDNTEWPALDYLVVDLPPGTGDVPLTLCQLLGLTGAVVVATPQQVALDDAIRAVKMFQQLNTPVLGLVENMSYFVAPDGSEHDIFGRGGTKRAAEALHLPLLGEIPMFTELRANSDDGRPHANFEGNTKLRSSLEAMVQHLIERVEERNQESGPTLEIS
jgi:ATP-binding protein involved in chromosome partitioning